MTAPPPGPPKRPDPAWDKVRALFDEVSEIGDAAAREARLAPPTLDPHVVREVRSLLRHAAPDDGPQTFLAAPALLDAGERSGQRLGAWRIVERLGSGGMGEVWLAQRADGAFEATAAIKLLRRGMDSGAVLARFELERRALARLVHPNIARLLDAGRSDDGLPYFVMEHVRGQAIDQACAGLGLEARLTRFLQLADAVAYAHRKLLVHRDLKPGNVLVDEEGQVKLLDFGIAKALESTDGALTLVGENVHTPQFASPEQVRGEPVGTATDVYSLGALLYLLLTGQRACGRGVLTAQQAARSVLEEAPPRPSALAPADGVPAPVPPRRLRGDLDNIVLKALEKDPERRYHSVEAFADDLRAHLAGRPVQARRPRAFYLLGRFIARNRLAVGAAALGVAGLVAGLVMALWQVREVEQARALAERRFTQVRQLAHGLVFRYHDQIVNVPGTLAAREALLLDASRYLDGLLAEGEPDPTLAREVAETYQRIAILQGEQFSPSLERVAEATRNLDKALALQTRYIGAPGTTVAALNAAADMWMSRSSLHVRASALQRSQQALENARALVERAGLQAPGDQQTLSRLATLEARIGMVLGGGSSQANLGRVDEALVHLQRAVRLMEKLARREPGQAEWLHQWAWACQQLGVALVLAGRAGEALPWGEQAVALRDEAVQLRPGDAHLRYQAATVRMSLALAAAHAGDHTRALDLQSQAARITRSLAREDPANKALARDLQVLPLVQARLHLLAGEVEPARALLADALTTFVPAGDDFYLARIRAESMVWAARAWRPAAPLRALAYAEQAVVLMTPAPGDENAARRWLYAQALGEVAAAQAAAGRAEAAARSAGAALQAWAATPSGAPVPGQFAAYFARDRRLAALD